MIKEMNRREALRVMGAAAVGAAAAATGLDALASETGARALGSMAEANALASETGAGESDNKNKKDMKVLMINGSPHAAGNTFHMLKEAAEELERKGIAAEIVQLGTKPVRGCIGCGKCRANGGRCAFDDDACNAIIEKMAQADGLIVGSPVYYGQPAGQVLCLLQRMAYAGGRHMQGKPAAAVAVCRRGGATAAFQALQMPFQMLNMPIVTSQYWNIGYGGAPGEVTRDAEGLQTMRTLADNMAYMLEQFATGTAEKPSREPQNITSFIR